MSRFATEKALSDRSRCGKCGKLIPKGTKRLSEVWAEFGHLRTSFYCKACGKKVLKEAIDTLKSTRHDLDKEFGGVF